MINLYSPNRSLNHFKDAILHFNNEDYIPDSFVLNISNNGKYRECYTPFEYVNTNAKIIIVGLTPGDTQWRNAVLSVKNSLLNGEADEAALKKAKSFGAFSGSMRINLVKMLDYVSIPQKFNLNSSEAFFDENNTLCHFTSLLTHCVQTYSSKQHKWANYSVVSVGKNEFFLNSIREGILKEINAIPNAMILTLGEPCKLVFDMLINAGLVDEGRVFSGMCHPSGASNERIAYFLNLKDPKDASSRTDPYKIFKERDALCEKLIKWNP